MDNSTAKRRAKQIALDIEGPIGRLPLERVFAAHIEFFDELRALGATWPQIAALLDLVGVTKKDGEPISGSQVRAMISRISTRNLATRQRLKLEPDSTEEKSNLPKTTAAPHAAHGTTDKTQLIRRRMQRAALARGEQA